MITKSTPDTLRTIPTGFRRSYDSNGKLLLEIKYGDGSYRSGQRTISYAEGPKRARTGNVNWKQCVHTTVNARDVEPCISVARYWDPYYRERVEYEMYPCAPVTESFTPPKGSFDPQVVADVLNQVDLNTNESVLLYSGILQAVPLVGGAFRLTSLLNRAAKRFKKDLRHKPFTTAVKTLISADFIDRFVLAPTIDDARRFADATNYVLRVIETARQRNATPTALSSYRVKTIKDNRSASGRSTAFGWLSYDQRDRSFIESKAFAYLDVRYDISAIDPIRFWANRVGLTRPLDSVWDLIPFSFVIDYFTRAGDFISALGDKMSSMDGLVGKVGKIHGFWGTLKRESSRVRKYTNFEPGRMSGLGDPTSVDVRHLGSSSAGSTYFTRFPISDPYTWLSRLEKDSGLIHLNLSPVRARTIVELLIQAKL